MLELALALGLFLTGFVAGALFIGQEIDLRLQRRHEDVHVWLIRQVNSGRRSPLFYLVVTIEFTVAHPCEGARLVGVKLAKLLRGTGRAGQDH